MSKGTRTYVTVYEFQERDLATLDKSANLESSQFFSDLVPYRREWGETAHIELEELDYIPSRSQLTFVCRTKWNAPDSWLKAASATPTFQGKLVVAASVNNDENQVDGYAFMNYDLLQEKVLLSVPRNMVEEMYANEQIEEIDNMIHKPIKIFAKECEDYYITEFPTLGVQESG
tara:strand:- start:2189 stop:2710 length:522 start_codon:yes stop_codon:yes gene_type:complete